MKCYGLIALFLILGCKTSQTEIPLVKNCPDNGKCEVEVLKTTRLMIPNTNGDLSEIKFREDRNFQVVFIKFTNTERGDYVEEIYLQIPSRFKEIHSKNKTLQNQKVVFGKLCDCQDKGFERIAQGELVVENHSDYISLYLEIKSQKTQKIRVIDLNI